MNPDDLNRVLRRQLRSTIEAYKDPGKIAPGLRENIARTMDDEKQKVLAFLKEEQQKQILANAALLRISTEHARNEIARAAREAAREAARRAEAGQTKGLNRRIAVEPAPLPRKITLSD